MNYSKKVLLAVGLIVVFAFFAGSVSYAKETNQVKCPVMGGAVDKNVYTDYQGKRIYFCCPFCIKEFEKSPEKYMKQFEKEGVVLEETPALKKK